MNESVSLSTKHQQQTTILSIAGSDSGGGAGIQADLRAFTALGTFGTTAITCITAQNLQGVAGIEPVDPAMVALQIRTVAEGFKISAVKTGMLYSAEIIDSVADVLAELSLPNVVVDPVMVATSGARLLKEDAERAMAEKIFPLASVLTPNVPELEVLSGGSVQTLVEMKDAAASIGQKYGTAVAAKAGHLTEAGGKGSEISEIVDVLWDRGEILEFRGPRVQVESTHGTGCSFASAMAATLAGGASMAEAVQAAKAYVADYVQL